MFRKRLAHLRSSQATKARFLRRLSLLQLTVLAVSIAVPAWGQAADTDGEPATAPNGDIYRIVVGLEQSGASASPSTNKFALNFFYSRPLTNSMDTLGSKWRLWSDVRIGTQPVQTDTQVSALASSVS